MKSIGKIDAGLRSRNAQERWAAAEAAGELGRTALIGEVLAALEDSDQECRYYAAWSGVRLGSRSASAIATLRD